MNQVTISDELKRRLLYGEGVDKDPVFLKITVERISREFDVLKTEIAVHIVDGKGVPLAIVKREQLAEGDTLTLDGLSRAFDIHIS